MKDFRRAPQQNGRALDVDTAQGRWIQMFKKALVLCTVLVVLTLGCDEDESPNGVVSLPDLEFRFLNGLIGANLMPIVLPDPIGASVVVEISNLTNDSLSQVSVPWADVILADSNQVLGRIEFSTTWVGILGPLETDTVTVTKINAGVKLFDPPCSDNVLLKLMGQRGGQDTVLFESSTLMFECVF